jgi:NADPH:quinone reductase-like Zn-dependent oxidoreductase
MRAAVQDRYGPPDVVRVEEVPDAQPASGQVLVRVRAAAVTSGDARVRAARFPRGFATLGRLAIGVRRPRRSVLGVAVSGVVERVGEQVTGLAVGDEVCGMTGSRFGAHAELVAVKAGRLVHKPAGVSHADAAAVLFGGTTAVHFLRDRLRPGSEVLVNGASGAVGSAAVQLAHRAGARVTGVCSARNADLVASLGADTVIDHAQTSVLDAAERYDVVLDVVGNLATPHGRSLLRPGGVLLMVLADLGQTLRARGDVVAGVAAERPEDVAMLLELVASGELRALVGHTFGLADIAEAYRVVESGRKSGNVVVQP